MTFRTSPSRSAWNCGTNTCLDISPAIERTMGNGANSKSSSGPRKDCLLLMSTRNPGIWHRTAELAGILLVFLCGVTLFPAAGARPRFGSLMPSLGIAYAQTAGKPAVPGQQPQAQQPPAQQKDQPFRITRDVNLVVLLASVVDSRNRFVPDLRQDNFHVYEDKVAQKLAGLRRGG